MARPHQFLRAVEGVDTVIRNLKRSQQRLATGTERGLRAAAKHLLAESQELVPVEYGELKASGTVQVSGKGFSTSPTIVYTAPHAIFVHENTEMALRGVKRKSGIGVYWGRPNAPLGQSKFLEQPARTEAQVMRKIIRDHAKLF